MGQAAGTLAALATRLSQALRAVPIEALQQALIGDGAWLGSGPARPARRA